MRRAYTLLFLGIWVAVLPYLGFPSSWKDVLFVLSGFGVMIFSYIIYRQEELQRNKKELFENFSENRFEDVQEEPKEF